VIDRARLNLGNFIIGRIEKGGRTFEMLLDPEKAGKRKKKFERKLTSD